MFITNVALKCKFCNKTMIKLPYEEIYYQRLEQEILENPIRVKSKKDK